MNVRLVIESAPHAQAVTERAFTGGRMVIGRGDDADWVIHDPDMYVSRQHCILTEKDGRIMATDASSSGLFIDNAANPVGAGSSVPVEPGMRLRMGDIVLRIEAQTGAHPEPAQARKPAGAGMVFDFSRPADEPPAPEPGPRPADLPDPFGLSGQSRTHERQRSPAQPKPLDHEDAFGLDLRRSFDRPAATPVPPSEAAGSGAGGYFGNPDPTGAATARPPVGPSATGSDLFADWRRPTDETPPDKDRSATATDDTARPVIPPALADTPSPEPIRVPAQVVETPSVPPRPPATPDSTGRDTFDALLRGMGLEPQQFGGDPIAQAEQLGRSMRILVEGLMQQLRTRAQAKQKARVAQTIIASAGVNPLKFLATADDVLASFVQPRGRGYLGAEDALNEAFRDLTDHQLRMWTALQTALRRMIDRFDPGEIEKAMADVGMLESLIAGGRSAKLWRLYEERYRDIARSAEDQFLGEVGADFREAYESGRRKQDDGNY